MIIAYAASSFPVLRSVLSCSMAKDSSNQCMKAAQDRRSIHRYGVLMAPASYCDWRRRCESVPGKYVYRSSLLDTRLNMGG